MRRIDLLITLSRKATESSDYTAQTGIQDEEFLQYATDAQDRIHGLILQAHSESFLKEKEIDCTQNQVEYSIPSDAYINSRIEKVEYSVTGESKDYYPLKQGRLVERDDSNAGNPDFYIRRGSKILLQPKPNQSGKIRLTYQYRLPRLDKRRGTVSSVTLDDTNLTITALTLDTTVSLDNEEMVNEGYICIVDKDGVVKMQNIPVSAVNVNSGEVTIDSGFTFDEDETIEAGDYVVLGAYSSTHSPLPDMAERYLIQYMNWKILKRDSSNEASDQAQEVQMLEQEIVDSFREPDMDTDYVPIINSEYLYTDYGY